MTGNSNGLERVQRRLTKICSEIKYLPYDERLIQLNLRSLQERRKRGDQINLYKLVNLNKIIFDQFISFNNLATRGHNLKLVDPRVHTDIGRRSGRFSVRLTTLFCIFFLPKTLQFNSNSFLNI